MNLTTGRQILDAALLEESSQNGADQKDFAIQFVGDELVRETSATLDLTTVTLTASQPVMDLTAAVGLDLFRPERFVKATIGLLERGAWATSTAYDTDEIVTSGGSMYRCSAAHTSSLGNTPPNSSYWALIYVNPVTPVALVDYETVRIALNRATTDSQVRMLSFLTATQMYLDAPPKKAYPLFLLWKKPFTVWTPGTKSPGQVDFNIPDDIMRPAIAWGAAAYLSHSDPTERGSDARWLKFRELVDQIKGRTTRGNRTLMSKRANRLSGVEPPVYGSYRDLRYGWTY